VAGSYPEPNDSGQHLPSAGISSDHLWKRRDGEPAAWRERGYLPSPTVMPREYTSRHSTRRWGVPNRARQGAQGDWITPRGWQEPSERQAPATRLWVGAKGVAERLTLPDHAECLRKQPRARESSQVKLVDRQVCKTVGFAYAGSDPGPATTT
jgi:hypothetical protein